MKENEMESYAEHTQRMLEQLMVPKKLLGPYGSRASAVEARRLYFKRLGIEDEDVFEHVSTKKRTGEYYDVDHILYCSVCYTWRRCELESLSIFIDKFLWWLDSHKR